MKAQREIASFVLRFTQDLWQDPHGEPRVEWRGQVRRVQDGEEIRFKDLSDAMSFIQESLLKLTMQCVPQDDKAYQEKAMQESLKFWEKFATGYTNMIVEAMQQSVKQSEAFQKQVSEAMMKPWWLMGASESAGNSTTAATGSTQLQATLIALQAQIEALNVKVGRLEASLSQNSTPLNEKRSDENHL
jgi:hypothetical protein